MTEMKRIGERALAFLQRYTTAFTLRLLALVTMLLDHIGYRFGGGAWLRNLGRISFPLYCFLIAEGFLHTRSRSRYALRLLLLALLSEIPYDLFSYNRWWSPASQNVFWTLLLGLLAAWWVEWLCQSGSSLRPLRKAGAVAGVLGACALSYGLNADYSFYGVLLIVAFAQLQQSRLLQAGAFAGLASVFVAYRTDTGSRSWAMRQWYGLLVLIPMLLYNGKPGPRKLKWVFYFFYPVHLLLLWGIYRWIR